MYPCNVLDISTHANNLPSIFLLSTGLSIQYTQKVNTQTSFDQLRVRPDDDWRPRPIADSCIIVVFLTASSISRLNMTKKRKGIHYIFPPKFSSSEQTTTNNGLQWSIINWKQCKWIILSGRPGLHQSFKNILKSTSTKPKSQKPLQSRRNCYNKLPWN